MPTVKEILEFATELRGKNLATAGGRAHFRVNVIPDAVCYTPTTGKPRKQKRERLVRILERYRESGSLKPVDYTDITRHTSYALGLIKAYVMAQGRDRS